MQRYHAHQFVEGRLALNFENGEFLCPMCKAYSNILLPLADKPDTKDMDILEGSADVIGWLEGEAGVRTVNGVLKQAVAPSGPSHMSAFMQTLSSQIHLQIDPSTLAADESMVTKQNSLLTTLVVSNMSMNVLSLSISFYLDKLLESIHSSSSSSSIEDFKFIPFIACLINVTKTYRLSCVPDRRPVVDPLVSLLVRGAGIEQLSIEGVTYAADASQILSCLKNEDDFDILMTSAACCLSVKDMPVFFVWLYHIRVAHLLLSFAIMAPCTASHVIQAYISAAGNVQVQVPTRHIYSFNCLS